MPAWRELGAWRPVRKPSRSETFCEYGIDPLLSSLRARVGCRREKRGQLIFPFRLYKLAFAS
jgi:hypothetical protein